MPVLDHYKIANEEDEEKIYCNCCGEQISKIETMNTYREYLHVEKSWGYFSDRDLTTHSFNICERCYQNWVDNFTIPIEEVYIDDIYLYSEEELRLLNEAYGMQDKCVNR